MVAFMKDKTLISYLPKKDSAVVLLSTEHRGDQVNGEESDYKADIALHYNKTKGAVHSTDKPAKKYITQRKSNQWLMVHFSSLNY